MAVSLPTAACETVDTKVESRKDPLQLCLFATPMSPCEMFSQTARYAKGPEEYLKEALGHETYSARKAQLSIPDVVDIDRYGTGKHRQHFEQHVATLLGKNHGLFFMTGVQAQLAALKIHCERAQINRVAWHVSSHLETAEERAFEALYGLERTLLGNDPEALPTVAEIKEVLELPSEERPAAVLVEVPNRVLGCKTYAFRELEEISTACKAAGVALHMDGARLWEIEPYYQDTAHKSFPDLAALFDSVYVSFYKGLGGASGAMLFTDDESFMSEAKVWQRRAGGTAITLAYEVADDERGYNENIGTFARKWKKMSEVVDGVAVATTGFKSADGSQIVNFVPEKPTCCQVHTVFEGYTAEELMAARDKVEQQLNVRVFEWLRPKKTVDETMRAEQAKSSTTNGHASDDGGDKRHFMEWMIMSVTEKIETQTFVDAYVALCEELKGGGRPRNP